MPFRSNFTLCRPVSDHCPGERRSEGRLARSCAAAAPASGTAAPSCSSSSLLYANRSSCSKIAAVSLPVVLLLRGPAGESVAPLPLLGRLPPAVFAAGVPVPAALLPAGSGIATGTLSLSTSCNPLPACRAAAAAACSPASEASQQPCRERRRSMAERGSARSRPGSVMQLSTRCSTSICSSVWRGCSEIAAADWTWCSLQALASPAGLCLPVAGCTGRAAPCLPQPCCPG